MIDDQPAQQSAGGVSGQPEAPPADASLNKATARVLDILSAFLGNGSSLGVSEISRKLGMTKSMVYRGLTTLTANNYLVRDETGTRYQLGYALAEFGALQQRPPDIHRLCRPAMEGLREVSGETVSLHIPIDTTIVCIDGVEGSGPIARRVPLGHALPLHASPASRAVLGFLPDEEIESYLTHPLQVYTDKTLRTPQEVRAEVQRVRKDGFARPLGDRVPHHVADGPAFPVLDMNGEPHGSIAVAGPADRFTADRIAELLGDLLAIMRELNRISRLHPTRREPVRAAAGARDE